ncbi:uncharacterized protein METZ01_LOCUS271807 [marine metagenome]|uniref:Uncharacterized protein n=1 Tax=marine metagenome TaxID=408172 RepID=A0A382K612_9ZZZZ
MIEHRIPEEADIGASAYVASFLQVASKATAQIAL